MHKIKHVIFLMLFHVFAFAGVTNLKVEDITSTGQSSIPVTVGQVFSVGDVPAGNMIYGLIGTATYVPVQLDAKAAHPDGSLRHAVLSFVLPRSLAGQSQSVDLYQRSNTSITPPPTTPSALLNAGFTSSVNLTINGEIYSASADDLLRTGNYTAWLSGSTVNEWLMSAPLKNAQGANHPHLTARFAIRSYSGINKARVDVTIENNWAYEPLPQNFTYDAQVLVGGQTVFSQAALKHFHKARWRKTFWWGVAPQVHVRHNTAYLMASKALPNYDTSFTISQTGLNALDTRWNASNTAPMGNGIVTTAMPMTGGRPDIAPLPQWAALYLLSMDSKAKKITLGVGDLAGSWPIHYRDKLTDLPMSIEAYPYSGLFGSRADKTDPITKKDYSFPDCLDCSTSPFNYNPDANHQPSLAYLPYLVTGDYYHLEELHFWANFNFLKQNPYYRGYAKGLIKSHEVRGQGWSLRTLGQAAYITPDAHPMKKYFMDRVANNIDFYNNLYTYGNANQLGLISHSNIGYKTPAGLSTGLAPWMDDFVTWSAGYLVELGFTNAKPFLDWKSKFPVGRMTTPGYCWIDGAIYAIAIRPSSASPFFTNILDAYFATMKATDGTPLINSTGALYLDQPCASQAMADWRTQYDKDAGVKGGTWLAGQMTGYATVASGYPSNMQPALAVAATSGIPNAQAAWNVFISRPVKPDYSTEPQWAIVPRQ